MRDRGHDRLDVRACRRNGNPALAGRVHRLRRRVVPRARRAGRDGRARSANRAGARLERARTAPRVKWLDWNHDLPVSTGAVMSLVIAVGVSGSGSNTVPAPKPADRAGASPTLFSPRPPEVSARAGRRRGRRAALRRRLRGPAARSENPDLAPLSGGARRPRHLLRPALRARPRDARRARGDPHATPDGRRSGDARRDPALHEAVLDQHRARTTTSRRASSCSSARPRRFAPRPRGGRANGGATFPLAAGRDRSTTCSTRLQPLFFDPDVDPMVTQQDARRRARTSCTASANNLYVGVTMEDLEGFEERYALNSRLVKQRRQAGRRGLPGRRPLRRADRGDRPASRGRDPVRHRRRWREALRRADHVLPDRRDARPRGLRHRVGRRTRTRRSTRSTGSSRSTWTRAASRARGRRSSSTSTARRPRRSRRSRADAQWFEDRMPWDPTVPQAGRARRHRARHRRRRRDRRLGADHADRHQPAERPGDPRDATAASRCRCRTSTRRTTSRRCRRSAASSAWTPEEAARAEKWSALAGELTTEHARSDRPRVGQGRRAAERQPADCAEGAVLGARGSARRSRGAVLRARPEARRARARAGRAIRTRSCAPNTRPTRATRWCSCGACARARRSKKTTCATAR